MPNGEDHDLLQRIDERVAAVQRDLAKLAARLDSCQEAIVGLRVESAKYGALAGVVAALLLALTSAAVRAVAGAR